MAERRGVVSFTVPDGREFHFPHFSSNFQIVSSNIPQFYPQFGPPGGRVAHTGRPWLRHWLSTGKDSICRNDLVLLGRATGRHMPCRIHCNDVGCMQKGNSDGSLIHCALLRAVERVTLLRFLFGMHLY